MQQAMNSKTMLAQNKQCSVSQLQLALLLQRRE
jgi:hypothetical protein